MKPLVAILVLLFAACAGQAPPMTGDDGGDPPPHVKQPPQPREGGDSAPGCNGVTEAGKCQDGSAVTCDVASGTLRKKDCKALGKTCTLDPTRGAKCDTAPDNGGGGTTTGCGSVTAAGSCGGAGNQTATWCDTESNSLVVWNCADETNMECVMDKPGTNIVGAFCFSKTTMPPPAPNPNKCADLGIEGMCENDTTIDWCTSREATATEFHTQCAAGEKCGISDNGWAVCKPDPTQDVSDCATIGYEGICKPDGTVRYCTGSGTTASPYKAHEKACAAPQTCQVNACGTGAFCCGS
jgi:hypothetical protein